MENKNFVFYKKMKIYSFIRTCMNHLSLLFKLVYDVI